MDRIKGLSTGSKIVLACGSLLFFSLFATWQHVLVVYGRSGQRSFPRTAGTSGGC